MRLAATFLCASGVSAQCATGNCGATAVQAVPSCTVGNCAPSCATCAPAPQVTMQTSTQQVVTNQVTQQVQSSCQWEVEVEWLPAKTVKQDPVFNLEEIFLYTPEVAIHETEIPYTHFKVVDKDLDCVATPMPGKCEPNFCSSFNEVKVTVTPYKYNILRIVPSLEIVKVPVPSFHYHEKDCRDKDVHVKVWRDVEIVINRNLPSIDEGDCAAAQVKYTCSKTNHVVNVQQPQVQNIQVQTPVVTQPPPQPTCATCNCAAPTPICAQSGCCR